MNWEGKLYIVFGTIADHKRIKIIEYLSYNCVRNRKKEDDIFNFD